MNIVMIASESRPFVKTGGLADVVYSLSKELAANKQNISIIMPFYKTINKGDNKFKHLFDFTVAMSWRKNIAKVYTTNTDNITYYFIQSNQYFERDHIYGEYDDMERFAFFSHASKILLTKLDFQPDIIHVHDWHAGMVPCLIKEDSKTKKLFKKSKIFFTIHNPAFQGLIDKYYIGDFYNLPDYLYDNGTLRHKDCLSTLKAGLVYADKITTVSPNHREELLTASEGMGLDGVLELRKDDFVGILNGIDYEEFNPLNDKIISNPFSQDNFEIEKSANKKSLFKELKIKENGKPLYSLVSRLTWQKGMDLVLSLCYRLASQGANIVLLGSGERRFEEELERLRSLYPKTVAIYIGYSDPLAHKIYASSDFFIMPSLFEPCGLGQMIAQRYGTLPIVRTTGGLKDSVIGYNGKNASKANGFTFDDFDCNAINYVGDVTLDIYKKKDVMKKLVLNALKTNNSWKNSAEKYLILYKKSLNIGD